MRFTVPTITAARAKAAELNALYADTDWEVRIIAPLFDGDLYSVVVE